MPRLGRSRMPAAALLAALLAADPPAAPWSCAHAARAAPTAGQPAAALERPGLVYAVREGAALRLDLQRPAGSRVPAPVVVLLHGGGWRHGRRDSTHAMARRLAARGIAAASVSYRLGARFPAAIEDARCAVRWLRAHADGLGIDPERVGALGWSAGGQLALLLGTLDEQAPFAEAPGCHVAQPSRVSAVVAFHAPTDLREPILDDALRIFLGPPGALRTRLARLASPISHLDASDAPMLLVHGARDRMVPFAQARALERAAREAGVPCTTLRIEGAGHGQPRQAFERTTARVLRFLEARLHAAPPLASPAPDPAPARSLRANEAAH